MIAERPRNLPAWLVPALLGLGLVAILTVGVAADPAPHVTWSASPFADEGGNAINARNLVLLGRWSTDGWNLYLVDLPLSSLLAGVFALFGVGIIQARMACIVVAGLLVLALGWGLARPFGRWSAALATLAVGTTGLLLYYGRLVYQEDLVAFFLAAGVLTLTRDLGTRAWRWGVVGGSLLALGIGTKPSAIFSVAGVLVAVAFASRRSTTTRRWLEGAVLAVLAAGLVWLVAIWLPNRTAIADVMRIWPTYTWPTNPLSLAHRVLAYVVDNDDALRLSLPLAAAGLFGLVAVIVRRRSLDEVRQRVAAAAIGWLVGGLAILVIASYRPNRYVLPIVPAAGILAAAGFALAWPWVRSRLRPSARLAVATGLGAVLVAPGLATYGGWVVGAPSTAPSIQASMARLVPSGSVVAGVGVGLLMMRAPVVTINLIEGLPRNSGDVYHSAGARWYLTTRDVHPYAVTLPPGAWDARRKVACVTWAGAEDCLFQVP